MTNNNKEIEKREQKVARPLSTISNEIKETFTKGKTAATEIWRPFEEQIGLLLEEARAHFGQRGGFEDWFQRQEFSFSLTSARGYRQFARELGTLPDYVRREISAPYQKPLRVSHVTRAGYIPPIPDLKRIRDESAARAKQFMAARQSHQKENKLIQALALKIIDAGFKILSTTMHPDKGGSTDAMRRLNAARAKLKHAIQA